MLARVRSSLLQGIDALPCEVEVDCDPTAIERKPLIVGLPDAAVKESLERVWAASTATNAIDPRPGRDWPDELTTFYRNWPITLRPHQHPRSDMDEVCNKVSFMFGQPYQEPSFSRGQVRAGGPGQGNNPNAGSYLVAAPGDNVLINLVGPTGWKMPQGTQLLVIVSQANSPGSGQGFSPFAGGNNVSYQLTAPMMGDGVTVNAFLIVLPPALYSRFICGF